MNNKDIVRIWLYKITREELQAPGCKPSATNKLVAKEVRGDFVYYDISNQVPKKVTRADADRWSQETGQKVETLRGYPTFMHDLGYRV